MSEQPGHTDLGLTHIALPVADLDRSVSFYEKYARMKVVHRRDDAAGVSVVWLSDLTRPFVIVLITIGAAPDRTLGGAWCHLGVAVESRAEVDRLLDSARKEGFAVVGPNDYGPPVGYWAYITDPDGHNLEVAYGQSVAFTVESAREP